MGLLKSALHVARPDGFGKRPRGPLGGGQGGPSVAKRWRIRHKLLLGLGLVLCSFALVLAGAVHGLTSYMDTMKTLDCKYSENVLEKEFKQSARNLLGTIDGGASLDEEETQLRTRLTICRSNLAAYETQLDDTISRGRDPDMGVHEKTLIKDINAAFTQFEQGIATAKKPTIVHESDAKRIVDEPAVQTSGQRINKLADELSTAIGLSVYKHIGDAKKQYHRSMAAVIATSVLGVVIMAGLLRFFHGWIFQPLHKLQEGVRRVAGGNFDGKIELNSADELEELADAFNDMTRRLHAKYSDLTHQFDERGKQLVRSERLASVGFLAAGVAHEINNPLASIAFCAEALERRLAELLNRLPREQEAVGKYLKMIEQEAFRCKAITQNLLEFSRVGEGQRVPTDLSEVVQSVLEMAQHLKASEGKRVVFRPTSKLIAQVNPQEIRQVILNMVVNAMESMDEGGTLTIALAAGKKGAEIVFADSGCGMPHDVLENIFEPFFTRSRTGKGTGLGLSISHRIVNQHGGEIEATSAGPDRGSTFVVRLPIRETAAGDASDHLDPEEEFLKHQARHERRAA
jgi:two-component system NtrC family sensor kinase